jgi:paraquat-inducible protein A
MLMATMLAATEADASVLLPQRTRLYYVVAWIGRWSMVDIFMESLLGALVQFGSVVTIEPGVGAVAFCGVVFLTIFAAEGFDPRLMWDAAGRNGHRPLALWRAPGLTGDRLSTAAQPQGGLCRNSATKASRF